MTDLKQKLEAIAAERANKFFRENRDFHDSDGVPVWEVYQTGFSSATDILLPLLTEAIEALQETKCDEVINYEGSGMFNKHDINCKKCKALNSINEKLEEWK